MNAHRLRHKDEPCSDGQRGLYVLHLLLCVGQRGPLPPIPLHPRGAWAQPVLG